MGVPTEINVVNKAMRHIGERPISSIRPPRTMQESVAAEFYDDERQTCLRQHQWNFALAYADITLSADTPPTGWAGVYDLPADFLRFISVNNIDSWDFGFECGYYKIIGEKLLYGRAETVGSPANSVSIKYIRDVEDPSLWSPDFLKIMALQLAVVIAYPITKSSTVLRNVSTLLDKERPAANSVTIQENGLQRVQYSKIIAQRRNGGRYRTDLYNDPGSSYP